MALFIGAEKPKLKDIERLQRKSTDIALVGKIDVGGYYTPETERGSPALQTRFVTFFLAPQRSLVEISAMEAFRESIEGRIKARPYTGSLTNLELYNKKHDSPIATFEFGEYERIRRGKPSTRNFRMLYTTLQVYPSKSMADFAYNQEVAFGKRGFKRGIAEITD